MSVRELARQVDVDHTYISQIELGKVGPPVGRISMAIARALESNELMELAQYSLVRQLLIMEMQLFQMYDDMPADLLEELKISNRELYEITGMCSRLIPRLHAAKDRREKPSDRHPMSPEEEKEFLAKLSGHNNMAATRSRKAQGRRTP
jgi:transcriptional regulator with XRE-family HTH domain